MLESVDTTRTLTEAQLAYVAGLVDSRAALSSRTVAAAVLPQVALNGGPMAVLEYLGGLTDTKVVATRRDYSRSPCAEHCTTRHMHIESLSGRWAVSGAKATIILAAIAPYLVMRPAAVEDLVDVGLRASFKGATVAKMKLLGWPIPEPMMHVRAVR